MSETPEPIIVRHTLSHESVSRVEGECKRAVICNVCWSVIRLAWWDYLKRLERPESEVRE